MIDAAESAKPKSDDPAEIEPSDASVASGNKSNAARALATRMPLAKGFKTGEVAFTGEIDLRDRK